MLFHTLGLWFEGFHPCALTKLSLCLCTQPVPVARSTILTHLPVFVCRLHITKRCQINKKKCISLQEMKIHFWWNSSKPISSLKDALEDTAMCFLFFTRLCCVTYFLTLFSGYHSCALTKLTLCFCYTDGRALFNRAVLIILLTVAVLLTVITVGAVTR